MTESLTLMQALAQFHFLRPLWLLALIPALFFFSRLWRLDAQGSAWHKVIDQSLLPYLLSANKSTSQRLPLILLIAAWVISVLALAGPTWSKQTQPVQERQEALVIVLDLSLGMFANDQDPNRITVARRKIMDLLDTRREGQTGLVVYAGEAHLVTPLTDDSITIRAMIPALSPNIMPVIGNNPAEAIAMANSLMDDASAVNGRILLITSNVPREQNAAIQEILSHNRYPLHIIGVGTPQGAAIPVSNGEFLRDNSGQIVVSVMDRGNLRALADSLNGRYSDITINASDLETVLADSLLRGDDDAYLESEEEVELWQDAGPWLLILLLPLCALCFRRGWVLQLGLSAGLALTMLPSPPAQAQEQQQAQEPTQAPTGQDPLETQPNAPTLITEDDLQEMAIGQGVPEAPPAPREGFDIRSLWLNRDQRGVRYLEEGDPYTAASLFQTPEWRGAAAFRAGDYQAAINAFSQDDDIESIYNLGNALAFAERLEEAIAAYERVLAQDPQHADALKNKQIVEDLLEEQQQQEQEQQEQQEQEEQQQQESQSESDSDDSEQDQQQEQEEQQQQEQSQEQQDEQQQESESENADQGQQRSDAQVEQEEDQESLEQFLRRIEDDPGELLQRKFQFESRRRMIERRTGGQNSQ